MPRLIWSRAALFDVQRLRDFLAGKSAEAARRAIAAIRSDVKIIQHQPAIGRPVEGMDPEYREWLVDFGRNGYSVLYRLDGENAVILSVRHQREAGY